MMMISKKIDKIINDFKNHRIEIRKGLTRNTYEIINRIYFYRFNQFVECTDENAIFWQVVTPYLPHFSKLIDFDIKDIKPKGIGDVNYYQSWILRKKFEKWVEENNFGVDIDDATRLVSTFGSFMWKYNEKDDKVEPVDLRNIYFDQTVKSIKNSDVVELHYMSENQIREKNWKNKEKIIENADEDENTGKKIIWEFWGYKNKKYKNIIGAGSGDKEVVAGEFEMDKSPYYDFHLWEYNGMWLRSGIYEMCFPEQERANTVVNENAQATSIASLLLLRSQDPNLQGNVLSQALSGQIITSSDLEQVGMDNRAFTVLLNELEKIETQVRKKLMLPDIATGETLPSGTPFRGMSLMASAYQSAFKQIRARVSSTISDVLVEKILPNLIKEWNKGDIIEISESSEDIKLYDEALKKKAKINMYKKANEEGVLLTDEDDKELEEKIEKSIEITGRKIETPKGFFNFKYGIRIDPVGETYDKAAQNDAIINALTMVSQNPTLSDMPAFKQLLENNGIPPFKITPKQKEQLTQEAGGEELDASQFKGLLNKNLNEQQA